MTKNQIEYAKLLETHRANVRNEQLTQIRDANTASLGFQTLGETNRHNLRMEEAQFQSLGETTRHNEVMEQLQMSYNQETERSHRATEELRDRELNEQYRSNTASEAIRRESNRIQEFSARVQNDHYLRLDQETKRSNQAREAEAYRSNLAQELESHRANVARETETYRHNRASEGLSYQQIGLGYSQLYETERSNRARESELIRSNMASESELQRYHDLVSAETNRSNLEQERLRQQQLDDTFYINSQQLKLDNKKVKEVKRHNEAEESQTAERVDQGWFTTLTRGIKDAADAAIKFIPLFGG